MYSKILVTAQFTLIAAIVQYCKFPFFDPIFLFIGIFGGMIGLLAIFTMRLNNLRVQPIPKPDAELITSGIYNYIRHPMYSSVLLLMLPFVINTPDRISLTLYFLLVSTLIIKLSYEERLLEQKFPSYSDYVKQTYRLIPFIYKTPIVKTLHHRHFEMRSIEKSGFYSQQKTRSLTSFGMTIKSIFINVNIN